MYSKQLNQLVGTAVWLNPPIRCAYILCSISFYLAVTAQLKVLIYQLITLNQTVTKRFKQPAVYSHGANHSTMHIYVSTQFLLEK